jgi:DNA invertase Pin-like site-specific DNA recombinase
MAVKRKTLLHVLSNTQEIILDYDLKYCSYRHELNIARYDMSVFVSYYRVSTDRQGASGLGLEAHRCAVMTYIAGRGKLAAEFTEIESGRWNDRPELHDALAACQRLRAVLVIAKLDRLARSVSFIANLMDSGVEFVAVDMPQASRLTLHILAAVAEHEREMISARTKAALAAAKVRGVRLATLPPT